MALVGIFGIAHNNRLVQRYEANRIRLSKVARELEIESVVPGPGAGRWMIQRMRFWFYLLYFGISFFWIGQLAFRVAA